jgi:hypothetical protein
MTGTVGPPITADAIEAMFRHVHDTAECSPSDARSARNARRRHLADGGGGMNQGERGGVEHDLRCSRPAAPSPGLGLGHRGLVGLGRKWCAPRRHGPADPPRGS